MVDGPSNDSDDERQSEKGETETKEQGKDEEDERDAHGVEFSQQPSDGPKTRPFVQSPHSMQGSTRRQQPMNPRDRNTDVHQRHMSLVDASRVQAPPPYLQPGQIDTRYYPPGSNFPYTPNANVVPHHSYATPIDHRQRQAGVRRNFPGNLGTHTYPYAHLLHPQTRSQQASFYNYSDASAYYHAPQSFPRTTYSHPTNAVYGPQLGYAAPSNYSVGQVGQSLMPRRPIPPAAGQSGQKSKWLKTFHHRAEAQKPLTLKAKVESFVSSTDAPSSSLRGPPKKPKHSGHALWCGNLPSNTHVTDLKDYFSRGATEEIESVFLISRSNCAFINYKTQEACAAALTRFHDSRFQGSKLLCRLRKPTTVTKTTTTESAQVQDTVKDQDIAKSDQLREGREEKSGFQPHTRTADKFFVMKSLTVEDLETSVRTGSWATQSHNEATLNAAFQSAENVYMVFSANKSGEYFGYARMVSPIEEELKEGKHLPPQSSASLATPADTSITTYSAATEHAPKGYIIEDEARSTIFWEADRDEPEAKAGDRDEESSTIEGSANVASANVTETAESEMGQQTLGRPFRVEWLSTQRVPFHRARGLRNPWNQNREVKIARDGTEIEPSVGKRLVQLFSDHPVYQGRPGRPAPVAALPPAGILHPGQHALAPAVPPIPYNLHPPFNRPPYR